MTASSAASSLQTPVLIAGAGLAGLSTAYHLPAGDFMVVEREAEVGGTARSIKVNGFTFDFTGHLLHLHHPYTRNLITRLLKGNFYKCERDTWIYSKGVYTRYPFQANTFGLPEPVVDECVLGFYEAMRRPKKAVNDYSKLSFREWSLQTFGRGICEHFMFPYNEKLYQCSLNQMSSDWCGPFVPTPKLEEVIRGALESQDKKFGYNPNFLYPKKGGIQELPLALARNLKNIHLSASVARIHWREKRAVLSSGLEVRYKNLVNTIPLVPFLDAFEDLPENVRQAKRRLKYASILCINLGVRRSRLSEKSWIYFPEKKFPFYRVGFPMNFTPHVVPRGCSSMYVETPLSLDKPFSQRNILNKVRQGLVESGILKKTDTWAVVQFIPIRYAYVVYDRHRPAALSIINSFLNKNGIQSIGRYGEWKYSFMEEAILDGKKAAEKIAGNRALSKRSR